MQDSYSSRELLAKLVAIDTTSSKSNLDLIDWVTRYLARHGVQAHVTTDDAGTKANLFATLGPDSEGGICLHGHTDVVPIDGQAWSSPAFELTERAGMLFGRGTADMKGFVACALAAVPQFLARRLKTPIHIALSYDEEVGCLGTPRMIRSFGSQVAKPQITIVGEPTLMHPVIAHKGCAAMETRFEGKAAHASMPQLGANAMTAAAEMVAELGALCRELRTMRYPYPMTPSGPTFNVGTVRAGTARNIVAKEAVVEWEIRYRDTDSVADIQTLIERRVGERIRRVLGADAGGVFWETFEIVRVPSFCVREDGKAVTLLRELGAAGASTAVPYGAEAGQYAEAGIDCVVFGPGSIEQAHRPDEFITLAQLEACNRFMGELATWAQTHNLASHAWTA
jgi:acetylornithine deacetylase